MKSSCETALVRRLRAGEREALREVYERFKGDVLTLVAAMLGHREAAWDVLHDVFVSLPRNVPHLAPDTNLRRYLLAAGANRARDVLSKRRNASLDCESVAQIPSRIAKEPATIAAGKEEAHRLWKQVVSLPEEQRVVTALHIYGGLTFKEIAATEGISENTAKSRYRYALKKVRIAYMKGTILHLFAYSTKGKGAMLKANNDAAIFMRIFFLAIIRKKRSPVRMT